MKAKVKRPIESHEFPTQEGCVILEVYNDVEDGDVSIVRARVRTGVTTQWHSLSGVNERYIVTSGSGLVDLDGLSPQTVGAGDVVVIPAGTPQRITNTGRGDLEFYCVCAPRFEPGCNQVLEEFEPSQPEPVMNPDTIEMLKKLIDGEIAGKNAAIHAYDKIIWTVRSGFLGLLFAAWGMFLTASVSQTANAERIDAHLLPLFIVSIFIAFGGFLIDKNYVVRKFRVIDGVNRLLKLIVRHGDDCIKDDKLRKEELEPLLQVSGDSGSFNHKSSNQYPSAIFLTYIIYIGPIVGVGIAARLLVN